jgi:hypothetical protein
VQTLGGIGSEKLRKSRIAGRRFQNFETDLAATEYPQKSEVYYD